MSNTNTEAPFVVSHNFCAIRANTVGELIDRLRDFNAYDGIDEEIATFRSVVAGNAMSNAIGTARATLGGDVVERTTNGPETVENKHGDKFTYNHPDAKEIEPGVQEVLREWTDRNGKARKAFVDPAKGPKPCSPGNRDKDYIRWV